MPPKPKLVTLNDILTKQGVANAENYKTENFESSMHIDNTIKYAGLIHDVCKTLEFDNVSPKGKDMIKYITIAVLERLFRYAPTTQTQKSVRLAQVPNADNIIDLFTTKSNPKLDFYTWSDPVLKDNTSALITLIQEYYTTGQVADTASEKVKGNLRDFIKEFQTYIDNKQGNSSGSNTITQDIDPSSTISPQFTSPPGKSEFIPPKTPDFKIVFSTSFPPKTKTEINNWKGEVEASDITLMPNIPQEDLVEYSAFFNSYGLQYISNLSSIGKDKLKCMTLHLVEQGFVGTNSQMKTEQVSYMNNLLRHIHCCLEIGKSNSDPSIYPGDIASASTIKAYESRKIPVLEFAVWDNVDCKRKVNEIAKAVKSKYYQPDTEYKSIIATGFHTALDRIIEWTNIPGSSEKINPSPNPSTQQNIGQSTPPSTEPKKDDPSKVSEVVQSPLEKRLEVIKMISKGNPITTLQQESLENWIDSYLYLGEEKDVVKAAATMSLAENTSNLSTLAKRSLNELLWAIFRKWIEKGNDYAIGNELNDTGVPRIYKLLLSRLLATVDITPSEESKDIHDLLKGRSKFGWDVNLVDDKAKNHANIIIELANSSRQQYVKLLGEVVKKLLDQSSAPVTKPPPITGTAPTTNNPSPLTIDPNRYTLADALKFINENLVSEFWKSWTMTESIDSFVTWKEYPGDIDTNKKLENAAKTIETVTTLENIVDDRKSDVSKTLIRLIWFILDKWVTINKTDPPLSTSDVGTQSDIFLKICIKLVKSMNVEEYKLNLVAKASYDRKANIASITGWKWDASYISSQTRDIINNIDLYLKKFDGIKLSAGMGMLKTVAAEYATSMPSITTQKPNPSKDINEKWKNSVKKIFPKFEYDMTLSPMNNFKAALSLIMQKLKDNGVVSLIADEILAQIAVLLAAGRSMTTPDDIATHVSKLMKRQQERDINAEVTKSMRTISIEKLYLSCIATLLPEYELIRQVNLKIHVLLLTRDVLWTQMDVFTGKLERDGVRSSTVDQLMSLYKESQSQVSTSSNQSSSKNKQTPQSTPIQSTPPSITEKQQQTFKNQLDRAIVKKKQVKEERKELEVKFGKKPGYKVDQKLKNLLDNDKTISLPFNPVTEQTVYIPVPDPPELDLETIPPKRIISYDQIPTVGGEKLVVENEILYYKPDTTKTHMVAFRPVSSESPSTVEQIRLDRIDVDQDLFVGVWSSDGEPLVKQDKDVFVNYTSNLKAIRKGDTTFEIGSIY